MNTNSGHRAAFTLPAAKQDAQPAFTGKLGKQTESRRYRLLSRIEEEGDSVERVLALDSENYEHLSAAAKMAHRMRVGMLAEMKKQLADLEAAQASNQGGAI